MHPKHERRSIRKLVDRQGHRARGSNALGALACVLLVAISSSCSQIDDGDASAQREQLRREEISCGYVQDAQSLVNQGMYDSGIAKLEEARRVGPQNPPTDRALRYLRQIERDASSESRLLPRVLDSLTEAAELLCP
jgi:hypothetical protein